jgi:hypothetical protein
VPIGGGDAGARAPRSRRVGRVRRARRGRDARAGERRHRRARAWIQALEALDETRVRVCARYTSIQKYFYPVATLPVAKRRRRRPEKKKLSSKNCRQICRQRGYHLWFHATITRHSTAHRTALEAPIELGQRRDMRAQSSESRGDERVPSWKLVALTATLLLFFVGPLILISWLWGGPGFCPAIPMMEIMTNINDKMSSPNPDGGADLVWGTGVCTIYLKPYDEDFDETESETNDFGVKIVMHEYVHCLQHGLVSGDADPAVRYDDIEVIVENPCGIPDVYVEKTKDAFVALPDCVQTGA